MPKQKPPRLEYNSLATMTLSREPLYRRHLPSCKHIARGRGFTNCACPVYCDYIGPTGRVQESLRTTSWSVAQSKLAIRQRDGVNALHSLKDALAAWDKALVAQRLRDSTLIYYRRLAGQLQTFCDAAGFMALEQITTDVLDQFRASRPDIATTTSSKELTTLKVMFEFFKNRIWIMANPARLIKAPKVHPKDEEAFTEQEVIKILAACDAIGKQPYERLRARGAVLMLFKSGMRISDVIMARRDQIVDGILIKKAIKNRRPITVPLPQEVLDALARLPLPNGAESGCPYYFWNGKSEPGTAIASMRHTLELVYKKSGVAGAHNHRFRLNLASNLAGQGVGIETIADILGISPLIAEKHYRRFVPARQDRINEAMDRLEERPNLVTQNAEMTTKIQ